MKRQLVCLVVFAATLALNAPSRADVYWLQSFQAARLMAKGTNRPILFYFYGGAFPPPVDFQNDFETTEAEMATRDYVCVRLSFDDPANAPILDAFDIHYAPVFGICNSSAELVYLGYAFRGKGRCETFLTAMAGHFKKGTKLRLLNQYPLPAVLPEPDPGMVIDRNTWKAEAIRNFMPGPGAAAKSQGQIAAPPANTPLTQSSPSVAAAPWKQFPRVGVNRPLEPVTRSETIAPSNGVFLLDDSGVTAVSNMPPVPAGNNRSVKPNKAGGAALLKVSPTRPVRASAPKPKPTNHSPSSRKPTGVKPTGVKPTARR